MQVVNSLADALGVSPAYLLGLTDDPLASVDPSRADGSDLDAEEEELLAMLRHMDREQKRTFLDIARMILRPNRPRIIGDE